MPRPQSESVRRRKGKWRRTVPRRFAAAVVIGCVLLLVVLLVARFSGGPGGTTSAPPSAMQPWPDPDPNRPRVTLSFVMSADLSSATGRETVTFTPSEQVCELVFRAWPNVTTSGANQDALRIDSAVAAGAEATARFAAPVGGSGTSVSRADHSLYVIPLASCSPANEAIKVELTFSLRIPKDLDERMSRSTSPQMAWLATAYPLLAWQRGVGWVRDAASAVAGEAVTSRWRSSTPSPASGSGGMGAMVRVLRGRRSAEREVNGCPHPATSGVPAQALTGSLRTR